MKRCKVHINWIKIDIYFSDELLEYKAKLSEKDKKIKEMVDSSTGQASKQTEIVKLLAEENKILKAEIAAIKKKQVNSQ